MNDEIERDLTTAFQNVNDDSSPSFVVVKNGDIPDKFFQFAVTDEIKSLDFPVIETNENTEQESEVLKEEVSEVAVTTENAPTGGKGVNIELEPDTDLRELSLKLIDKLWGDIESIETETQ